jgi:hypothetical protein
MHALLFIAFATATASQVSVEAAFLPPAKPGADAAIAVMLEPQAAGIVVNEKPAPRLSLDPLQTVLVDRQTPRAAGGGEIDPSQARHLDPSVPVRFVVAIAPGTPRGTHTVRGTVTFFYCSKTEGWCKKGSSEIAVIVPVQ